MRIAAAGLVVLALAGCEGAGGALAPLDRLTVDRLRAQGDDPEAVRPVEHLLLPGGNADRAGLVAALAEAGFEDVAVRSDRGFEATVVFLSDARDRTLARQIAWLRENAPIHGYRPTGWSAEPRPA